MTHPSAPVSRPSLLTTWRPLLGAAALLCALSGDPLLAQNDWLKSKAKAKLDWALPDPKDLPLDGFRAVRDEIERRVRELREA